MKKQLLFALLGAALVAPISAQAEGAYVGFNVGRAQVKENVSGPSSKDHDTGYKFDAGYDFTNNFGVEAGYVDLGKYSGDKVRAIYIAGTGSLPLSQEMSLLAKIGVTENRVKFGATGQKFNHTAAVIGVGAAYHFSKNIALLLEYEHFGKVYDESNGNIKADIWSLGLRYKF